MFHFGPLLDPVAFFFPIDSGEYIPMLSWRKSAGCCMKTFS
jgi:hypothetical protein